MRSPFDWFLATASVAASLVIACGAATAVPKAERSMTANALLADVAQRCARVVACADSHDASQFRDPSTCVDWWLVNANDERPLADCVMHATTCSAIHACTHARQDEGATAYCSAHPAMFSACDGTRFISCEGDDGRESTLVDCATLGGTCGQINNGGLVVRGCVSSRACPALAPERRCENGALVSCDNGIAERSLCTTGTRCVPGTDENGAPTASCEATGAVKCTSTSMAKCEDDVAVACVVNGRYPGLHRTNCADYGLTCAMRGTRTSCVSREATCAVGSPARCDGDAIVFCAAGHETHVSCKEMGFASCGPGAKGPSAACHSIE